MNAHSFYQHCAAPHVPDALPSTLDVVERLIVSRPEDPDLRFLLGNLLLAQGEFDQALPEFRKVLELKPEAAMARCNSGICYFAQGDLERAASELSQAILQDQLLLLGYLYLGRTQILSDNLRQAVTSYGKALDLDPKNVTALAGLAAAHEKLGDEEAAKKCYERLRSFDPDNLLVEVKLGEQSFDAGKYCYDRGELPQCIAHWGEGYRKYPRAFSSEKAVANEMRRLVADYNRGRKLREIKIKFLEKKKQGAADPELAYRLVLEFLFSLGLQPELYAAADKLEDEVVRWKGELEQGGTYPYAHLRLGVLYAYCGKFGEALSELVFCNDHLPGSKSKALKLNELIPFARELAAETGDTQFEPNLASTEEWEAQGFADVFSREAWRKTGLAPAQAAAWREAEMSPKQTEKWQLAELALDDAVRWRDAGFPDPKLAKRWLRGGFDPHTANTWRELFSGTLEQALQFKQAGFSDPRIANDWLNVFAVPFSAAPWHELGFTPQEASSWIKTGVTDPFSAKQQKTQDEAAFAEAQAAESGNKKPTAS